MNRAQSGWAQIGAQAARSAIAPQTKNRFAAAAAEQKRARQANAVRFLIELLVFPAFVVGLMCLLGLVATLMDGLK